MRLRKLPGTTQISVVHNIPPARRHLLQFIVAVVVLHGVAIALYYGLGIPGAPVTTQRLFAWAWMGATVALVFVGLRRVKRARRQKG